MRWPTSHSLARARHPGLPLYTLLLAVIAAGAGFVEPASARDALNERPAPRVANTPFTVASWDLRDAEALGLIKQPKPVKQVWRHTFGAERRARPKNRVEAGSIDADVVLLQGVRSAKMARAMFPARDWKLILSRQLLEFTGLRNRFSKPLADGKSITAIAVRYSRHVRITGHEHLMWLATPVRRNVLSQPVAPGQDVDGGDANSGDTPSPIFRTIARRIDSTVEAGSGVAGLAVRISHRGHVFWVVTADLGGECADDVQETCIVEERLQRWTDKWRGRDVPIIRGLSAGAGKTKTSEETEAQGGPDTKGSRSAMGPIQCTTQILVADDAIPGERSRGQASGCMASLKIAVQPRRIKRRPVPELNEIEAAADQG